MRAGASAVADRARYREDEQHDRKVERAVERGIEDVAPDDVDDDGRQQRGEDRAAAIERDRMHDAVDRVEQHPRGRREPAGHAHLFIAW